MTVKGRGQVEYGHNEDEDGRERSGMTAGLLKIFVSNDMPHCGWFCASGELSTPQCGGAMIGLVAYVCRVLWVTRYRSAIWQKMHYKQMKRCI